MSYYYYRTHDRVAEIFGLDGCRFRCIDGEWHPVHCANSPEEALIVMALDIAMMTSGLHDPVNIDNPGKVR